MCCVLQSHDCGGKKKTLEGTTEEGTKGLIQESEELFQDLSQMQETWLAGGMCKINLSACILT